MEVDEQPVENIVDRDPEAACGHFPLLLRLGLCWDASTHAPLLERLRGGLGDPGELEQLQHYADRRVECCRFAANVLLGLHPKPSLSRDWAFWQVVLDSSGPTGLGQLKLTVDCHAPNLFEWLDVQLDATHQQIREALANQERVVGTPGAARALPPPPGFAADYAMVRRCFPDPGPAAGCVLPTHRTRACGPPGDADLHRVAQAHLGGATKQTVGTGGRASLAARASVVDH